MAFITTPADLDLWPAVKKFYQEVFLPSGFYDRLNVDLETLRGMFTVSLVGGIFGILILQEAESGEVVGLAALQEIVEFHNLQQLRRTFLRGVFIKPHVPRCAGQAMDAGIEEWARARGHDMLIAYTRLGGDGKNGFKHRACESLYGYKPLYTVIGKYVEGEAHG